MTTSHTHRWSGQVARHSFTALSVFAVALASWSVAGGQSQTFTVTNQAMTAYLINGQANPTLQLVRGATYTFSVNAPTNHQFWIKTAQVTGTGSAFNEGVTNNGTLNGTITFSVPSDAPSTLFYQCQTHSVMTGTLQIANPMPALGGAGVIALGLLLGAFTLLVFQRRRSPA